MTRDGDVALAPPCSRRSRIDAALTLSPSWPANGPSLMRKVIDSVGGSIGWAWIGFVDRGSHSVSATVACVMPAMATMSPASAPSTGVRSRPRKASTL